MSASVSLEQDYSLLIKRGRKNPGTYTRTAVKAGLDLSRALLRGERPFRKDAYLYEGSRALAQYCIAQSIEDVVLIDKSARPLWAGIAEYWKRAYPNEQRPGLHFLNPAMLRAAIKGSESPGDLSARLTAASQLCLEQMTEANSPLVNKLGKPLLLADTCMHSGIAVHLTRRVLEAAGFEDLRVGVVKTTLPKSSPLMPDVYGTNSVVAARCYRAEPESSLVTNDGQSIYSSAIAGIPEITYRGAQARQHIAELIAQQFAADAVLSQPPQIDGQA